MSKLVDDSKMREKNYESKQKKYVKAFQIVN